ncbi:MAG: HNH endonuclease [Pseudomonadota bacterium]
MTSTADHCWLCKRALGRRIEWHHPVPKSRKGKDTVAVHPICHRTIHANFSNAELARQFHSPEALRRHPEIARFLQWVQNKPPDFHAPTRLRK